MRSALPKVLHRIAGRSMLAHVLAAVERAGAERIEVVIGPGRPDVRKETEAFGAGAHTVEQTERLGTAHAVLQARDALAAGLDDVVVAYADTPLVSADTFARLRAPLAEGAAVAVLGFEAADPTGYGRLLTKGGDLVAIREERDASPEERRIRLSNAGLMALRGDVALALLEAIGNANAKGEYYLTDAVEAAVARGERAVVVEAPEEEVAGVNDRAQLAIAEGLMQRRLREAAMAGGVTLVDPSSVHLSSDTRFGRDVIVEPHVVFGPGVTVADDVTIRAFSHLEGAEVGRAAIVGPYARLRPGAKLGAEVHVGNFVEVKNSELGEGVKANHLAYLGDATIGARTNVGAGTITCNYDGIHKHRTIVGEGAFIGTNSSLVAPVTIGDRAYIGSGSVVTEDVPAEALAIGRGRQVVKEGWAKGKTKAG
jgi:bifunctional UDP-N-acetylglucosamine pyrophosphorylase/glucosamine-1-phosphate N-acetyltransferase